MPKTAKTFIQILHYKNLHKGIIVKIILLTNLLILNTLFAQGHHPSPNPPTNPSLSGHLSYRNKTIHLHTQFESEPTVGKEATLLIQARSGSDHSAMDLKNTLLAVELWMPAMQHGSSPTKIELVLDSAGVARTGLYRVRNIYFIMGGEWEVKITLIAPDGSTETKTLIMNLPDSHQH